MSLISFLYDFINVSEKTAIAAHKWVGKNDEKSADHAAVQAMRGELNKLPITGTIVIGEGERDKAPMLHIGEKVGLCDANSLIKCDIAVDPLECTTACAQGLDGSMATMLIGNENTILHAPDIYMKKIAVGNAMCKGKIGIDLPISYNIEQLSKIINKPISDITVAVLNRDRHTQIIKEIISAGAKIKLISDGDVAAAIATCVGGVNIDMYYGIGGAPEGVIAASAVEMLGGYMECKLVFKNDEEKMRTHAMFDEREIKNSIDMIYSSTDLVRSDEAIFLATGITDGILFKGISNFCETLCIYRDKNKKVFVKKIRSYVR